MKFAGSGWMCGVCFRVWQHCFPSICSICVARKHAKETEQDVQMKPTWFCKPDSLHESVKGGIRKPIEYLDVYRQHRCWT